MTANQHGPEAPSILDLLLQAAAAAGAQPLAALEALIDRLEGGRA